MRIGLSTNTLQHAGESRQIDGIGVYTAELLQGLLQQGQQVISISDGTSSLPAVDASLPHCFFKWPFALSGPAAAFLNLATPGQRQIASKIDVYHCTDYHQPLLRKVPIVTTLHDAVFLQQPSWCRQNWRWLKNHVIRRSAQRAERVICVSHAAKRDIMQYFAIDEQKISVIYHGVDAYWSLRVSETTIQSVLQHFNIKRNYLLFTGTIQPRKNVLRLLQAYQLLPIEFRQQFQLVVVGKPGWDEPALTLLQQMAAQSQVQWLGYVTRSQLRCLYQASTLFVFPSLYEGFGLPVLEAFASGAPVISANSSALPEVCADAALLIEPEDVDALAVAIEQVLTDRMLRQGLIERGTKRAADFNWQTCVQETLQVYRSI